MIPNRLLVVIASYGRSNDKYLERLVQEYRSMSFAVDIVVCSNIEKPVPKGARLVVGMPNEDPWSLPFAHKQILADGLNQYDLFIYSEDDTLARERNIHAFLHACREMRDDELPGFIRYEVYPDGRLRYCDVNGHYHWDASSIVRRGEHVFAFFTNEHAAFYLLTRDQLRRAIASGGFLVPPHRGKYDLACTAATDPYTQCGFRKLVCISALEDFQLQHLPNKYLGTRFGTDEAIFRTQVEALMQAEPSVEYGLIRAETRLQDAWYSKDYYEPLRMDVVNEVPVSARRILSVGCGAGTTEKWLAARGAEVTAVCLDPIIGACARNDGVEAIWGGYQEIRRKLEGRSYDCLLLSNILHLAADPFELLAGVGAYMAPASRWVILNPNLGKIKNVVGKLRKKKEFQPIGDYEASGVHDIRIKALRQWLADAGLDVVKVRYLVAQEKQRLSRMVLGMANPLLAHEMLVVGQKRQN